MTVLTRIAPRLRALFLDLDDTILRFSLGQPDAWHDALVELLPPGLDVALCLRRLRSVGREYWSDDARAFWGRQNLWLARREIANAALSPLGVDEGLRLRIADSMTRRKEDAVRPFEGALAALSELRRHYPLALLTNGCSEFQRRKLRRYGLEPYFELILVEGELGFGKPDARVFQWALRFFDAKPGEAVMVGDNLRADIYGAQALGIPAIWHDPDGCGHTGTVRPTATVRSLPELLD